MKKLSHREASHMNKISEVMDEPMATIGKKDTIRDPFTLLKDKNAVVILECGKVTDIITTTDVINYLIGK
jgi:predicted transcriptional regulator